MLDIKLIRENPNIVKADLEKRGARDKLALLEEVQGLDQRRRDIIQEANELKHKRNTLSQRIGEMKKKGEDISGIVQEVKDIPNRIKALDEELRNTEDKINQVLMSMPNILHESVPVGKDEEDNEVVREWGEKPEFSFQPKDHIDLAEGLGLMDIERAARAAGARFYYLKGDLALLNTALVHFGLDLITERGYTLFQPPYMLRRAAVEAATDLGDFEDVIYKIEEEDLYLLATSEHALLALHMGEIILERDLPLRYAGISPCFRKEAGAHGRDTKGIFRVHQFEKVEQFIFCRPEESWDLHEELLANAEEVYQKLEIPYRVVNICTGDIGTVAAKKYDIEVWLPGQGKYREVVSCSNCTDYQARRAKVRYHKNPGDPTKPVHTLNSTLVATERTLVAILENYQREDGSVEIPEVLRPYMGGKEEIGPAK